MHKETSSAEEEALQQVTSFTKFMSDEGQVEAPTSFAYIFLVFQPQARASRSRSRKYTAVLLTIGFEG